MRSIEQCLKESGWGEGQGERNAVAVAHVPWSKVAILGMVIPPLIGILIMGI